MVLGVNQNLAAKSPRLQHNEEDEDQLNSKEIIINLKNRTRTIALPKINLDKAKLNQTTMAGFTDRSKEMYADIENLQSTIRNYNGSVIDSTHTSNSSKIKNRKSFNKSRIKRSFRFSSNPNEEDPDLLCSQLIENTINHSKYNPKVFDKTKIKQIKKVILKNYNDVLAPERPKSPTLIEKIIDEQLLSRNEQNELNNKRAKSHLRSDQMSHHYTTMNPHQKQSDLFQQLTDEIAMNEQIGYVPPRTLSRMRRVRNVAFTKFEKQFIKPSNTTVVNVPSYLSYFEFKKNEDTKQLAKDILQGNYDFKTEEEKLNRLLYSLLNRSEKHAFFLESKKDKQLDKVRFQNIQKTRLQQTQQLNASREKLNWINALENQYNSTRNNHENTNALNINEDYETVETQQLLKESWNKANGRATTISPSKKVKFITEVDQTQDVDSKYHLTDSENDREEEKDVVRESSLDTNSKINGAYVKETVRQIIMKSNQKVSVDTKLFDDIRKIEKQRAKVGRGIGKFLDLQEKMNLSPTKKLSIMEFVRDQEIAKKQNTDNFTSKEIIDKVKRENFENSVYINYLGKGKIWKPDKFFVLSGRKSKDQLHRNKSQLGQVSRVDHRKKSIDTLKSINTTQSQSTLSQSKSIITNQSKYRGTNQKISQKILTNQAKATLKKVQYSERIPRVSKVDNYEAKLVAKQINEPMSKRTSQLKSFQMFSTQKKTNERYQKDGQQRDSNDQFEIRDVSIMDDDIMPIMNLEYDMMINPDDQYQIQSPTKVYSPILDQSTKHKCEINMDLKMFSDNSLSDISNISCTQSRAFTADLKQQIKTECNSQQRMRELELENLESTIIEEAIKINQIRTKSRNNNIAQYIHSETLSPRVINGTLQVKFNGYNKTINGNQADFLLFKNRKFAQLQQIKQHELEESSNDEFDPEINNTNET